MIRRLSLSGLVGLVMALVLASTTLAATTQSFGIPKYTPTGTGSTTAIVKGVTYTTSCGLSFGVYAYRIAAAVTGKSSTAATQTANCDSTAVFKAQYSGSTAIRVTTRDPATAMQCTNSSSLASSEGFASTEATFEGGLLSKMRQTLFWGRLACTSYGVVVRTPTYANPVSACFLANLSAGSYYQVTLITFVKTSATGTSTYPNRTDAMIFHHDPWITIAPFTSTC